MADKSSIASFLASLPDGRRKEVERIAIAQGRESHRKAGGL
jgi:hypothetical protein